MTDGCAPAGAPSPQVGQGSKPFIPHVRGLAEQWRTLARERGVTLSEELPSETLMIIGDRLRLDQLFGNLLDNASKFSPGGARMVLTLQREGQKALVSVADTGPGIPPSELSNIFRPFYQIGPRIGRRSGSGLGLAMAQVIVERHGGSIQVESEPGRGSTFHVRLPLASGLSFPRG